MNPSDRNLLKLQKLKVLDAVREVAKQQNLHFERAIVLSDRSNILIHLYPLPIVARVAAITGTVRQGNAWLEREIAVSNYLANCGAPVISPSNLIHHGVYNYNNLVMSFWEFVQELTEPVNPILAGKALRTCHQALVDFSGELPVFDPISESEQIFTQLRNQGVFTPADADILEKICDRIKTNLPQLPLPMQPVHGDSNGSNVINTTKGVLWIDWEDTFIAPVYWDLACFVASSRVFATDIEQAEAFLTGYGIDIDSDILDLFIEARTFQTLLWNYLIGQEHPSSLKRFETRLKWLRDK